MSEQPDRNDMEELIRDRTEPGLESAMLVLLEGLPDYIRDIGMLRTAAATLRDSAGPCSCGKPDCLAAPQHKALYQETLDAALDRLDRAVEAALQAITTMAWEIERCQCEACKQSDRREAAPYN